MVILLPVARQQQTVISWNLLNVPIYELMSAQKGKETKRKEKQREWKPAQCEPTDTRKLVLLWPPRLCLLRCERRRVLQGKLLGREFRRPAGFPATSEICSTGLVAVSPLHLLPAACLQELGALLSLSLISSSERLEAKLSFLGLLRPINSQEIRHEIVNAASFTRNVPSVLTSSSTRKESGVELTARHNVTAA